MIVEKCDKCEIEVYNSNDERRFIQNEIIDNKIICVDCIEEKKEDIIGNIYDDLFPEMNQLIDKVMEKHSDIDGELLCSKNLDYEYRETFEKLSKCIYKQLQENWVNYAKNII